MQSYQYYSRTLLIEFLQRTIFFYIWKMLNKSYYGYFMLVNKNRLFISYNSSNWVLEWYIKYEDRNRKDCLLKSMRVTNNAHLESFANLIDKSIQDKNLKRGFLKIEKSDELDLSLDFEF